MFQEAEKLMQERERDFPNHLLKARDILSSFIERDGNARAGYEKLLESLFWLGYYSESKAQKEKYFTEGAEIGKKAVSLFPESADANFWYAMHLALYSVTKGIMKSLFNAPVIRKHGQKALDLDEDYFFGGPLRLMGRSYHKAPAGNLDKAIELLERAVKKHPDFQHNHVFLADAYISKGRKGDAKKLLDGIIGGSEPENHKTLFRLIQTEAKGLLAKV